MKLTKEQPKQKQKKTARSAPGPESASWNQMNRKQRREMARKIQAEDLSLTVVHPNAAGIDIGNESHYVAVPSGRDEQSVRRFGCTTAELKAMAACLKQCGIGTVALQSTGVYWIAVYDILEAAGLEVYLVCTGDEESAGAQDGRAGKPMADEAAHLRTPAEFVSTVAGNSHHAELLAAASGPGAECGPTYPADAESTDTDEHPTGQRVKRYRREERTGHYLCQAISRPRA